MNYIDYIIIAIIIIFIIKGLFRGLIIEVIGLVGQIVSVLLAVKFSSNMSGFIRSYISIPSTFSTILGFLAVFIASHMTFQVIGHLLQKFIKYTFLGWLEKLAGGMVGFTKGSILASLLVLLITIIPMSDYFVPDQKSSVLMKPIGRFAPKMYDYLTHLSPNTNNFKKEIMESLKGASQYNLDSKEAAKVLESLLNEAEDTKNQDK